MIEMAAQVAAMWWWRRYLAADEIDGRAADRFRQNR
jgi:hypothetical protein